MKTASPVARSAAGRSLGASSLRPPRACAARASASSRPPAEESARSLVDIADCGTLSSLTADGWPLGTHASYLLDADGQPLLRLRAASYAALQLKKDSRCSLYVQARVPVTVPQRIVAHPGPAAVRDAAWRALASHSAGPG